MSIIQSLAKEALCSTCVHKGSDLASGGFHCKILDRNYLLQPESCEEWEEAEPLFDAKYDCD